MTSTAVIVPRAVLGGPGNTPPSERINIAYIGCGTQGMRNLIDLLPRTDARVVAVCDPNTASNDYVEWGHNEIRDRIRSFLGDQSWGQNTQGCRCGRQVGLEIVHRHYANTSRPTDCTPYIDFRDLLQNHKDLDACYIMTPEHLHAAIAVASMKHGKHVVTHKPIANVMNEVRLAENTARQTGRATHLFCSAGLDSTPLIKEWITAGAIGSVRQVHNWSTRPFWPQGMYERPPQQPVPDGLNWDLWLGPVPHRPYNLTYTHAVFRGWCDFGSGALGDMGHYSSYQIFKILDLPAPVSVEASRSQYWAIENLTWQKKVNDLSYPRASRIHWRFPARQDQPPVDLYWYDGGILPDLPEELEVDNEPLPDEGLLFVGDRGKLLAGFSGGSPRLIPKKKMKDFTPPPQTLARPKPELDQWLTACKGGAPSDARFEITAKLSETVAIGNVALRVRGKLLWDSQNMKFTNNENANEYLRREYRPGWEL
jgi:predicted dehydrogenase